MTTKTIFNMDVSLKKALMRKAKSEGLTLSDILNISARAYVNEQIFVRAIDRNMAEALDDIAKGKTITQKDLFKRLGI